MNCQENDVNSQQIDRQVYFGSDQISEASRLNFADLSSERVWRVALLATDDNDVVFAGLPCNCAPRYEPVCAVNGQTFPNNCVAR